MNKPKKKYIIFRGFFLGLAILAIAFFVTRSLYHHEEAKHDALRRIRERGCLVALTDQNNLNYFIYKGEPMGYQLKLLESFAKHLGVPLRIIACNDIPKLEYYLRYSVGDLVALNLPISRDGKKLVRFSEPFGETRLVLVQRSGPCPGNEDPVTVKSIKNFPSDTVYVRKNPFMTDQIHDFYKKTGRKAILKEETNISQEELLRRVSAGIIRFALCQENVAMVYDRYYRNLDISVPASARFQYAWGVGLASDSLRTEINGWLKEFETSKSLKKTYLTYFNNRYIAGYMQSNYISITGNKISPYDDIIREQSKLLNWDWRLVASLIYEESHFQTGLVSSRSASGLMQLMPETAAKFGISSTSSPAQQIAGGVKCLRYLDSQLSDEITNPVERICFVLASYNVGPGKVMAAREKAAKSGRDRNKWNGHVDYYLLHRSKREPVAKKDSTGSFPVDYKTEGFVDNVINRYYHYKNLIK